MKIRNPSFNFSDVLLYALKSVFISLETSKNELYDGNTMQPIFIQ